jgi:hypothetical protein
MAREERELCPLHTCWNYSMKYQEENLDLYLRTSMGSRQIPVIRSVDVQMLS